MEEEASPPRESALDKKLREEASMEEKKERERKGGSTKFKEENRERS